MQKAIIRVIALCLTVVLLFSFCCMDAFGEPNIVYRYVGKTDKKRIALTFDDGPHPRYTPQILDILNEFGVEATFFVVGTNAETYPELIEREQREGHEIGNHTYNHYHTAKMSAATLIEDILACSNTLERITGSRVKLFRPPEGVCTPDIKTHCEENDFTIVMWSVDTRDWAHPSVTEICRNVKEHVKNGSIILMHDFIGKNSPTPEALRRIIPMLQESGYEFVTVSRLLQG
ncbi:MAG: polysaccharide deacetylase family protein [Ruminococcaceae bacterium]|nr:polysaccharide deacetylase family protein [Oscillospiraceae bacterium]